MHVLIIHVFSLCVNHYFTSWQKSFDSLLNITASIRSFYLCVNLDPACLCGFFTTDHPVRSADACRFQTVQLRLAGPRH